MWRTDGQGELRLHNISNLSLRTHSCADTYTVTEPSEPLLFIYINVAHLVSPNLWEPLMKTSEGLCKISQSKLSLALNLVCLRYLLFLPLLLLSPFLIQHLTSLHIYSSTSSCAPPLPFPSSFSQSPLSPPQGTDHSLLQQETIYQRPYLMNLPEGYSFIHTHSNMLTGACSRTHECQKINWN